MRQECFSDDIAKGAAALLTRIVLRKRSMLLGGYVKLAVCGRALPLNHAEARPLEAALRRNIRAVLRHPAASYCG